MNAQQPSLRVRTRVRNFFSLLCSGAMQHLSPSLCVCVCVCVCVFVFSFHYHNPAASPVRLDGDVCHVGCFSADTSRLLSWWESGGAAFLGNHRHREERGRRRWRRRRSIQREEMLPSNAQQSAWAPSVVCCWALQPPEATQHRCVTLHRAAGHWGASVWSRAGADNPRLVWLMRWVLSSCFLSKKKKKKVRPSFRF